jgi:chromosome segregation ATPase
MSSVKNSSRKRRTPNRSSTKKSTSPIHTRISNGTSSNRGHKYTETELNNYLNRVVDKHFAEAKGKVDADLSQVSDCLYLNKFSKMANAELINPSLVAPGHGTGLSGTGKVTTELDQTASPSKLRGRYNRTAGRSKSPNSRRTGPDMTSLLMDTETRRYVNEYKNQLEYLRNVIYALDLKLRDQETWKREVNNLREENENGSNAREELRKTLLETTQELKGEATKLNKVILDLEGHNSNILGQLKAANNAVDDIETKLHSMEVKNAQLENENNELRAKINSGEIYKAQLQQSRNDYLAAERRHADALNSLGNKIRNLEEGLDRLQKDKRNLTSQNNKLNNQIATLNQQLAEERANNNDLTNELDNLRSKFQIAQTSSELLGSIQAQRDGILNDLNKTRAANEAFQNQIEQMEADIIERSRDIEAMERKLKDDVNRANKRIRSLEENLNQFKNDNHGLKKENIELRNHIITLEQLLCVKEDVYAQLQDANNRLAARTNDCDQLRAQLDGAAKVQESQNDKIYELEKCLIYLKNVAGEKEDVSFQFLECLFNPYLVHHQLEEIDSRAQGKIPDLRSSHPRQHRFETR